jgi:hypothetical protein
MLSIEAHRLLLDQEDGCITNDYRNGAPRIVMPRPGGPMPRTGGMVSDATALEVAEFRMAASIFVWKVLSWITRGFRDEDRPVTRPQA